MKCIKNDFVRIKLSDLMSMIVEIPSEFIDLHISFKFIEIHV